MLSSLRPVGIVTSLLAVWITVGCSAFSHTSGMPSDPVHPLQTQSSPQLHEALSPSLAVHSRHPLDVLYPPPAPLSEKPSLDKPAGDDVVWASGYWIWDTNEDNWHWVRGVWVHAPRGRRWTPGYWSVVADGWRWIPGSWVIDAPPPPYVPPPTFACAPGASYYGNPNLAFLTGYGWWGPLYASYPYHHLHHASEIVPVVAAPAPHSTESIPFPFPHLASNVHDAPASLPHLDMASILNSVPQPLANSFNPSQHFELHAAHPLFALHPGAQEHGERISSLFSTASHLETAHHEHLGFHGSFPAPSSSISGVHGGGSHSSEGHGGGHGR